MEKKSFSDKLFEFIKIYKTGIVTNKKYDWLVEFLNLLKADIDIYKYAIKAKEITEKYFGKSILLYAPLYISDYCVNGCLYCGFSALNKITRTKLSLNEIEKELKALKTKNFNTILILTGEDRKNSSFDYIRQSVKLASKYFSEVLVEVYPLSSNEYKKLILEGLCGVTLYQETYDEVLYKNLHKFGPKRDFNYRLNAPQRAAEHNIKELNIGALLGLNKDWRFDVFMTVAHAAYLQNEYPYTEVNISFPRIKASVAKNTCYLVSDRDFVKSIVLSRIFLPRVGINISTRENINMRDNLIGIGITRMSAESKTTVGGYFSKKNDKFQFEVSDSRSIDEIIKVLESKGYRAEFTNWVKNARI